MWTSASLGNNRKRHAHAVLACLCAFGAFIPPAAHAQDAVRVVALEWLPLHANTAVLDALEQTLARDLSRKCLLERVSVLGDQDELAKALAQINAHPPDVLLAIGGHVCARAAQECPSVFLIALFAHDIEALEAKPPARALILDTDPSAQLVWDTAQSIRSGAKRLGVLFTNNFAPNVAFVSDVKTEASKRGAETVPLPVNEGFCRTDSDFRAAIEKAHAKTPLDFLYVPDDPNASRFGPVIRSTCEALRVPLIGTGAIAGKGCAVSLEPDFSAIGDRIAKACLPDAATREHGVVWERVPPKPIDRSNTFP